MSLLDPKEDAIEVIRDGIDYAGKQAPGFFERLLDVLSKYEFCVALRKKAQ